MHVCAPRLGEVLNPELSVAEGWTPPVSGQAPRLGAELTREPCSFADAGTVHSDI